MLQAIKCHTLRVKTTMTIEPTTQNRTSRPRRLPVKANDITESEALSKSQEARLLRRKAEIKIGQDALASALAKSLVLLRFKGNCKCGLMLTEQDKNPKTKTYLCPQCGKSSALA